MTLGERIKKVRKSLDLTQHEFCTKIGFKQNSISLIESGKRNISDQAIKSICREFNVDENWLRTGEGEMFRPSPSGALDALAQEYGLNQFGRTVVEKMVNLTDKQWAVFYDFAMEVLSSLSEAAPEADTRTRDEKPVTEWTDEDIDAEVEDYRRELLEEKRQAESGSASDGSSRGTA